MEDILASIKRVIAEEKEIRAAAPLPGASYDDAEEDVLELDESMAADLGVDRVFSRGTTPGEVASFLVHRLTAAPQDRTAS